jgi:Zn-dependent alcohol dehydrogenase
LSLGGVARTVRAAVANEAGAKLSIETVADGLRESEVLVEIMALALPHRCVHAMGRDSEGIFPASPAMGAGVVVGLARRSRA